MSRIVQIRDCLQEKGVTMGVFDTCLPTFRTTTNFELPPSFRSRSTIDYSLHIGYSEI